MNTRTLDAADTPALEKFLLRHWASSMILRSNLRATPIGRDGPYAGTYAAKFAGADIVGVAAYYPAFKNIILQAPDAPAEAAQAAVGRNQVLGILGPLDQVKTTMSTLGLTRPRTAKPEVLYVLDIAKMRLPKMDGLRCRAATSADLDMLVPWRIAYNIESLRGSDNTEMHRAVRDELSRLID